MCRTKILFYWVCSSERKQLDMAHITVIHFLHSNSSQVVSDPKLNKSGVYWSWNNDNNKFFENQVSEEVADDRKGEKLWDLSMKLVGLAQ